MISEETIAIAIRLIRKGPANADYFFAKLNSPEWISPLKAEGVFHSPYSARQSGNTYSFPVWTPGEYLARMAAEPGAQEEVLRILRTLPESDNPRVYETVADAAAMMAPKWGSQLVPKVLEGLSLPFQLLLPEKAAELLVRLNEAGAVAESVDLAAAIFSVVPAEPPVEADGEVAEVYRLTRRAQARIDDWQYGQLLDRCTPAVAQPAGLVFFELFCDLLAVAVREARLHEEPGREDYSYIWRPTIAHPKRQGNDVRDHLVSAVRDLGGYILQATPHSLPEVVERLSSGESRIFDRLVLFFLSRFGNQHIGIVEEWFDGPKTWSEHSLQPEFDELVRAHFGRLSDIAQDRYLDSLDTGPDEERYTEFWRSISGADPTEKDLQNRREVWARDRLAPLEPWISAERLDHLQTLIAKHGPYAPVERGVTAMARGERSPLSDEDALSMDWQSLVAKVKAWIPTDEFDGPSRAGFEGSLRMRVHANPAEAIQHLHLLQEVEPSYVSAVLQALRDVVKNPEGVSLNWSAILAFLSTAVANRDDQAGAHAEGLRWVNRCAVSLIGEGLGSSEQRIPFDLREEVWAVLAHAIEDPDPTPESEERYGRTNMDPATLSLNTVRGEAFHQVVRYALWRRRHLQEQEERDDLLEAGLVELPEVRTALERHLNVDTDPSCAVRSVYGQWFPWLYLLDPTWATEHVDRIFPEDEPSERFFWAAWGAYVVYTHAYTDVLGVLRPKYRHAVEALAQPTERRVGLGERPAEHLAGHLMSYFWRAELSLDAGDLVQTFFRVGDPALCHHALESIGRGLWSSEDRIPADVTRRVQALWEWREAEGAPGEEVKAFGWWFGSGQLDIDWSIERLNHVLDHGVLPEPDHLVLERLAELAPEHPESSVRCLERLVDVGAGSWAIHGWLTEARAILEAALRSADPDARDAATRVVHRLGAMHFQTFRELLRGVEAL